MQELLKDAMEWRPVEYLRRINKDAASTPKDMYDAIFGYLTEYVEAKVKE